MEISYKKGLETDKYKLVEGSPRVEETSGLKQLLHSEKPLVLEDSEGTMWMRTVCGKRPC